MRRREAEVPEDAFHEVVAQNHALVRTRVVPREFEIMNTDAIPACQRALSADEGQFGYAIPREGGGLGLDLVQDVAFAMEFGCTSLSRRLVLGTDEGIAGQVLVGFGTDEQRPTWLPPRAVRSWHPSR